MMEWLRSIELAEFATNLRGTGVHGGLIALEPAFCDEHFATLLQMPVKKTLLRQHLQMKFQTLLDDEQIEVSYSFKNHYFEIFLFLTFVLDFSVSICPMMYFLNF